MTFDMDTDIRQLTYGKQEEYFYFDSTLQAHFLKGGLFDHASALFLLIPLPLDGFPVYCKSSYVSILFCEEESYVHIGRQQTFCFTGNMFLFRSVCDFIIKPEKQGGGYLALYKKEIFDTLFISQIADCPILYDFLNLANCKNEYLYFDCSKDMSIFYYARILQKELCSQDALSDKAVRCSTILFLTNLHRVHRVNLVIQESSMMEEHTIGNILKYMSENYADATLSNVAAHFNYHPAYFSTLFHRLALCSFTTKLQEMRLEQARRMLASTNFNIQKICECIGFKEKSHFYRCFKKIYGVTPGKYRRSIQKPSFK